MTARRALIAATCAWLAGAALAQEMPGATLDQRIDEGVAPAEPPLSDSYGAPDAGLNAGLDSGDASLQSPTGAGRLRTTLDSRDIEQRIDKGLTAAGERSAFPPDYAYGAFQRGWFLTAFSRAIDRARQNDPAAQTLLGVLLSRGLGVKQDFAAAADWFGLAGKAGDREALYALGQMYEEGQGVTADAAKAAEYFQQAADKGHAAAARELGYMLLGGKGRATNAMLAAAYLRRAATAGDMDAQYTLAGLFVEGVGVVADDTQAARWFGEAARNGHVGAEVEYAILLFNGRGVTKDEGAALSWLGRAADADNPVAQLRLARFLARPDASEDAVADAARWYLIAKARGLDDTALEEWLATLAQTVRDTAQKTAADWLRERGSVLRTASVAPPAPDAAAATPQEPPREPAAQAPSEPTVTGAPAEADPAAEPAPAVDKPTE